LELAQLAEMRLIVVEDEELVGQSLCQALQARGASVTLFTSALPALKYLQTRFEEVDCVLSDHGMAGMTGLELLGEVERLYPRVRRILLSGWGVRLPESANTAAAELILAKPIRAEELARALLELNADAPAERSGETRR
jgi:CheY-like chemotaxis protein